MATKTLTAIIAFHILILQFEVAKAQFSSFEQSDFIEMAEFMSDFLPLPDGVGNFLLSLAVVPSRIKSDSKIEHGPPNVIEMSSFYNNKGESPLYSNTDEDEYKYFQSNIKILSSRRIDFLIGNLVSKSRKILGTGGEAVNSLIGDKYLNNDTIEKYLEINPSSTTSFHFGIRNSALGHSLGVNPANVFSFSRAPNYNLPSERKQLETPGISSFGFEYYNSSIGNLNVFAVPSFLDENNDNEDRYYVSYGTLVGSESIDLRLFSFYDGEPLIGISVNTPTPLGTILYTDLTVKQGNGIQRVIEESKTGIIELDKEENTQIITDVSVGLNFAFGQDLLINAEYSHQSDGYDDREWANYYSALENYATGGKELKSGVISQIRDNYASSYLRRDYSYFRFYDLDTFGSGIETELSTMVGLNDFSGNVNLNLSFDITDAYSVEAFAGQKFGQSSSEFKLSRESTYAGVSLLVKY